MAGLVVDDAAWIQVGRDLKRLDPERYRKLLRYAQEVVSIHRDPLGPIEIAQTCDLSSDDFD